jgi:hypoxanthine phosphoribosyltransferase
MSFVLHPFLSKEELRGRVYALGTQLRAIYADAVLPVVMIPVLGGALRFAADLIGRLEEIPLEIEPLVARYPGERQRGTLQIDTLPTEDRIHDRDVLLVDDLVTSGRTLHTVRERIKSMHPRSIRSVVMLQKRNQQLPDFSCPIEHVLIHAPDDLYVGYGIDYEGRYRNLNYLARLESR